MAKFLILVFLVALAYFAFTGRRSSGRNKRSSVSADQPMVRCANCGTFVPREERIDEGDASFCCESHRQLGVRQK